MGKSSFLPLIVTFGLAVGASVFAATFAVEQIERQSIAGTERAMAEAGLRWTEVAADGLRLKLSGMAGNKKRSRRRAFQSRSCASPTRSR